MIGDIKRTSDDFSCVFFEGVGARVLFCYCLRDGGYRELGYTDLWENVFLTWILSWTERAERMDLETEAAGEIVLS